MYPIYTIATANYFHILKYLLDSLKDVPEVLENLTVIGSRLVPYQIEYLNLIGAKSKFG